MNFNFNEVNFVFLRQRFAFYGRFMGLLTYLIRKLVSLIEVSWVGCPAGPAPVDVLGVIVTSDSLGTSPTWWVTVLMKA